MPSWDPNLYLKFADYRLRPALDLLARIALEAPRAIQDLGCGPSNITRLLAERTKFLETYAARVAAAYPPQPDGSTLLPFNRIFLVARL